MKSVKNLQFKVWDKELKKMFDVYKLDIPNEMVSYWSYEKRYSSQGYDMPAIVVQYTGRKDKDDAEIFQSDIVSLPFEGNSNFMNAIIIRGMNGWEFEWINERVSRTRQRKSEPIFHNIHLWKVIGNIYQNPELLQS